jgi:hypothetical protein
VQSDMSSSSASQREDIESSTSAPADEAAHNDTNNVRGQPGATTRSQTAALGRRSAATDAGDDRHATSDTSHSQRQSCSFCQYPISGQCLDI